ncbi:MAG: hypothetical protein E7101_01115 [Prevotella ruminicola]|uniref:Uncharacterized protein n=1 Tax=Xylanibacter ruminicola TaxID=839 RepID=A0A9D5NZH2_XYLRU|nr:hypothetical protein [Xylanibacter ruminicola]
MLRFWNFVSCSNENDAVEGSEAEKKYFSQWNPCEALTALQEYVENVTNPKSKIFIRVEDRST